jgi:C-terminal peptidase prc
LRLSLALAALLAASTPVSVSARDYSDQADKVVNAAKRVESGFVDPVVSARFWESIFAAFRTSSKKPAEFDRCLGDPLPAGNPHSPKQVEEAIKCGKGEEPAELYVDRVLQAAMRSLGERNSFLSAKDLESFRVETGDYAMVGVSLTEKEGRLEIVGLHGKSPLRQYGVKNGDVITAIAGRSGTDLSLDAAIELLRGKADETVTISVVRQGEPSPSELTVGRKILEPEHFRIEQRGNHAIVQALTMGYGGSELLGRELAKPEYGQLAGVVLDLRNNQGGLLEEVVALADLFVDNGQLFYVRGRSPADTERFYAHKNKLRYQKPVVVLVNKVTASGGEIIAAVLQHKKRAHIMGAKTMGVVDIQTVLPIGPNAAIRLTTQNVYLPDDRVLGDEGVTPDSMLATAEIIGSQDLWLDSALSYLTNAASALGQSSNSGGNNRN